MAIALKSTHQKEHVDRLVIAVGDLLELQREQSRIEHVLAGGLYSLDVGGLGDLSTVAVCAQWQTGRSAGRPSWTGRRLACGRIADRLLLWRRAALADRRTGAGRGGER